MESDIAFSLSSSSAQMGEAVNGGSETDDRSTAVPIRGFEILFPFLNKHKICRLETLVPCFSF
jgi:hypothetical protein